MANPWRLVTIGVFWALLTIYGKVLHKLMNLIKVVLVLSGI